MVERRLDGVMKINFSGGLPLLPGKIFAIDVEGDGNSPPDLVDLAIAQIEDWATISGWRRWLFKPERRITRFATGIHHIRNKDVSDAPAFEECASNIRTLLDGATVIGHNVKVDIDVLCRKLPGWRPKRAIDTLRLAKRLLPGKASYSLQNLADEYGLAEGLEQCCGSSAHTAAYDTLLAANLLFMLLKLKPSIERDHLLDLAAVIDEPKQGTLF